MKKRLLLNTITSVLFQITTLVCGFIVPRLILQNFGSNVNGLVSSINQFLSLIAFLELGVGAVIQSSLYKPLADKDDFNTSLVLKSGDRFFKKIALILLVYVIVLAVVYPFFAAREFDWLYTSMLILAMSISSFAQYYFGIVDRLLLTADQRGYIQYISQIITLLINTFACALIIHFGGTIQIVKLTTSIIFLARPIVLRIYINKKYRINRKITITEEPIKQKWNGIAQHLAAVVLDNTDIIILTIFSTLSNVSIYSVYFMVVSGIKGLFLSGTNGIQSAMGEMIAKDEEEHLRSFFAATEFSIHLISVLLFTITAILIVPFVRVYTQGITDVNYIEPLFAFLLVSAHAFHCFRLPYNLLILAGGHFKQTQSCYIIAVIINISISIVTVFLWGLIGVAIGTLVAMVFQTIWMIIYTSKTFIKWPIRKTLKQFIFDFLLVAAIVMSTFWIKIATITYWSWIIMGLEVTGIALLVTSIVGFVFYRKQFIFLIKKIGGKLHKNGHAS